MSFVIVCWCAGVEHGAPPEPGTYLFTVYYKHGAPPERNGDVELDGQNIIFHSLKTKLFL